MKNKKVAIVLVAALAIGVGTWSYLRSRSDDGDRVIRVSGNIEATEIELSFRIAGWVQERLVDEGYEVVAGKAVARLDPTELKHQVDLSAAQADGAKAALAELQAGSRPEEIAQTKAAMDRAAATLRDLQAGSREAEIKGADAAVRQAQADDEFRKKDYDRVKELHLRNDATLQELDQARSLYDAAHANLQVAQQKQALAVEGYRKEQIEAAKRALEEATQKYEMTRKGPRSETIDQAAAKYREAMASLEVAKTRLAYTVVNSPIDGVVLSKNVEPGEYVSASTPIVTVADIRSVYLRAYINEPDFAKVKVGQRVLVRNDTYPDARYEGRITFIAPQAEFTPKNVQTEKERVKLVYRVKIDIDNPKLELKPGMPADGEIILGSESDRATTHPATVPAR